MIPANTVAILMLVSLLVGNAIGGYFGHWLGMNAARTMMRGQRATMEALSSTAQKFRDELDKRGG